MMGRSLLIAPDRTFPEFPGGRHTPDENASKMEAVKLLAVFVVDTDEKQLLTPHPKRDSSRVNVQALFSISMVPNGSPEKRFPFRVVTLD